MKSNYNFPKQNSVKRGIVLHFVHLLIIWTNRRQRILLFASVFNLLYIILVELYEERWLYRDTQLEERLF